MLKDRLKEKRPEAGLTQTALAAHAGVTTRTTQNYELGNRKPSSMEVIRRIADAPDGAMKALNDAYWIAKEKNKKYIAKMCRKEALQEQVCIPGLCVWHNASMRTEVKK